MLVQLPGEETFHFSAQVVLVDVVVQLARVDLGVALGLLDVGVNVLSCLSFNLQEACSDNPW